MSFQLLTECYGGSRHEANKFPLYEGIQMLEWRSTRWIN